jgi:hypothetical protein
MDRVRSDIIFPSQSDMQKVRFFRLSRREVTTFCDQLPGESRLSPHKTGFILSETRPADSAYGFAKPGGSMLGPAGTDARRVQVRPWEQQSHNSYDRTVDKKLNVHPPRVGFEPATRTRRYARRKK